MMMQNEEPNYYDEQKKLKITWEEYQRIAFMIMHTMKEFQQQNNENVQ
jgi:hypothetical protein